MPNDPFSSKADPAEYKLPDSIIIDDREGKSHTISYQPSEEEEKKGYSKNKEKDTQTQPISLRLLCFLGVIFCIVFGLGMLFFAVLASILALLTFFKKPEVNGTAKHFWKLYVNAVVSGVGFLLGIFVPPLGLGFLLLYYSMTGEPLDSSILSKIIKHGFGKTR